MEEFCKNSPFIHYGLYFIMVRQCRWCANTKAFELFFIMCWVDLRYEFGFALCSEFDL